MSTGQVEHVRSCADYRPCAACQAPVVWNQDGSQLLERDGSPHFARCRPIDHVVIPAGYVDPTPPDSFLPSYVPGEVVPVSNAAVQGDPCATRVAYPVLGDDHETVVSVSYGHLSNGEARKREYRPRSTSSELATRERAALRLIRPGMKPKDILAVWRDQLGINSRATAYRIRDSLIEGGYLDAGWNVLREYEDGVLTGRKIRLGEQVVSQTPCRQGCQVPEWSGMDPEATSEASSARARGASTSRSDVCPGGGRGDEHDDSGGTNESPQAAACRATSGQPMRPVRPRAAQGARRAEMANTARRDRRQEVLLGDLRAAIPSRRHGVQRGVSMRARKGEAQWRTSSADAVAVSVRRAEKDSSVVTHRQNRRRQSRQNKSEQSRHTRRGVDRDLIRKSPAIYPGRIPQSIHAPRYTYSVYISDQLAKDALGRVALAGGSLVVSTRGWQDHDGIEHRVMQAGAPDPLELVTVLRFLGRLGLVTENEERFEMTPLGRRVQQGAVPWPSPDADAVAAGSNLGIAAALQQGGGAT